MEVLFALRSSKVDIEKNNAQLRGIKTIIDSFCLTDKFTWYIPKISYKSDQNLNYAAYYYLKT